jgi:ubiquinone/menaquinone biosynthesis C-methylase UbiE
VKLKETFSTIPKQYDKARLGYPDPLFRDIIRYSKLTKNDPVLEIGIGTGKATLPFVRYSNHLIANDISRELVSIAKEKLKRYQRMKYIIGQFENIKLPKNHFKLIYSAQSFHWIKPGIQFTKTRALLKPGGVLALFWNFNYYNKGIGKWAMKLHKKYSSAKGGKAIEIIQRLKRHHNFTDATTKEYRRTIRMGRADYISMQTSFSWYLALSKKRKKQALAELHQKLNQYPKTIRIPIKTILIMARKK